MQAFKCVVVFTLALFMSMLFFVTGAAFIRKSGNTGLDMAKIHHLRDVK